MEWSDELKQEMALLNPRQQRAISTIVLAEANGVSLSRLLKTAYSCPWCGRVIGRSSDSAPERKALLVQHEQKCDRIGREWRFVVNHTTFYNRWPKLVRECLGRARQEAVSAALGEAERILQFGTPDAAIELVRQISGAVEDRDRRLAAVAVLDRADTSTASKGPDPLKSWLEELRGDKDNEQ